MSLFQLQSPAAQAAKAIKALQISRSNFDVSDRNV